MMSNVRMPIRNGVYVISTVQSMLASAHVISNVCMSIKQCCDESAGTSL